MLHEEIVRTTRLKSSRALEYAANIKFHQSFTLPANPTIGRPRPIRVTYSDVDYRRDDTGPVILLIGGMFGGRWITLGSPDALAKHHKLRLIVPDKPGLGGSEAVPLEYRIENWLDIAPALLAHLAVPHVVLMSHSNGAIYLLNTVIKHRNLLHPVCPSVVLLSPWVHPTHSSKMRYLTWIPNPLYRNWASVAKTVLPKVNETLNFSTGIASSLKKTVDTCEPKETPGVSDEIRCILPELTKVFPRNLFSENVSGGSDEAMICLKRGGKEGPSWGLFEDYDEAAMKITTQESRKPPETPSTAATEIVPRKLHVKAVYGESDAMIGIKGGQWFDYCWKQQGISDSVDFESTFVPGLTHEGIADPEKAILHNVLRNIVDNWNSAPLCRANDLRGSGT